MHKHTPACINIFLKWPICVRFTGSGARARDGHARVSLGSSEFYGWDKIKSLYIFLVLCFHKLPFCLLQVFHVNTVKFGGTICLLSHISGLTLPDIELAPLAIEIWDLATVVSNFFQPQIPQ